jgi:6-pyruvoyltetrahydropterin/6-carboxytetrahydropterin synthase
MYKVTKSASFAYGHRLLDHKGRCRNLHGHNGRVEVTLAAEKLDAAMMVADFGDLSAALKGWLDANLDHKTILCARDPLLPVLTAQGQECFVTRENPTAELLAGLILTEMKKLGFPAVKVKFWETETSVASCSEEN